MDLRGFDESREGARYELCHLINWMPLNRVLLIVDDSTQLAALRSTIDAAWARIDRLSPNRSGHHSTLRTTLRILRMDRGGPRNLRSILALLCESAATMVQPAGSSPDQGCRKFSAVGERLRGPLADI